MTDQWNKLISYLIMEEFKWTIINDVPYHYSLNIELYEGKILTIFNHPHFEFELKLSNSYYTNEAEYIQQYIISELKMRETLDKFE